MKRLLLVALPFALAACVPDDLASLESVPATTLTTTRDWQDAYRVLDAQMRTCVDVGGMVASSISSQLYSDRGEIVLTYQQNPVTSRTGPILQFVVRPASSGATVDVRQARNPLASQAASMAPRWLQDDTKCR